MDSYYLVSNIMILLRVIRLIFWTLLTLLLK